jgi:hypothetical protein
MLSEVRWAGYTLGGSHPGLHGILAEQPPAADALQPTLRCGFRAQLRRSVRLKFHRSGKEVRQQQWSLAK